MNPIQDLARVFAAMRRGTLNHKVRVLKVTCPNGHTLADVYRGESGTLWAVHKTMNKGGGRTSNDKQIVAERLERARGNIPRQVGKTWEVWCRDGTWSFPAYLLLDAISRGDRRLVISHSHNSDSPEAQLDRLCYPLRLCYPHIVGCDSQLISHGVQSQ